MGLRIYMVRSMRNPSVFSTRKVTAVGPQDVGNPPPAQSLVAIGSHLGRRVVRCGNTDDAPAAYFCIMSWTNSLSGVR